MNTALPNCAAYTSTQPPYSSLLFHADGNLLYRTLTELHILDKDVSSSLKMSNIVQYHGIGSGSIVAFLLYIGLSIEDIVSLLSQSCVFDTQLSELPMLIKTIIGDKLLSKFSIIPSLEQLYELLGSNKILRLYAYNTTTETVDTISHETCPDLNCITACMLSYNLGLVYYSQSYCGNTYIDASFEDTSCISFDVPTLCIHVVSRYTTTCYPTDSRTYYMQCAYKLRELVVKAGHNIHIRTVYLTANPWDESLAAKLNLMYVT